MAVLWRPPERPLLAVSGQSKCCFSLILNDRFREKQTFNMKQIRLVPRQSGHQMGNWSEFETIDAGRIRPNLLI